MILAVMLGVKKKLGGKIPSIKNLILLAYVTPGIPAMGFLKNFLQPFGQL